MKRLVRVGYAAKGVLYLLIGGLALQLALGEGGRLTDSRGALRTLLDQPFGLALLTAVAVGLLAYAAWELSAVFWLPRLRRSASKAWAQAAAGVFKGVAYGGVGWEALQLAMGAHASSGGRTDEYARQAMRLPFGRWALIAIGIGVLVYGVLQARNAWQGRLGEDLDQSALRREGLGWVVNIGRAGIGARAVVFVVIGALLARAAVDRRPSEAGGVPEALGTLVTEPFGTVLLAITAAGLVCFGVWQVLHARYARV
jgi:Domain of Unknown Function (DUF1206)